MNIRRFKAILKKEFFQIKRDPRAVMLVLIQPLIFIVLFGYGISFDVKHITTAVFAVKPDFYSRDIERTLQSSGYFDVIYHPSGYSEVKDIMDRGKIKVAIVLGADFSKDLLKGKKAQVQIILDGSDANTASVVSGYLNIILQNYSLNVFSSKMSAMGIKDSSNIMGLDTRSRVRYNPELKSSYFIVPGLIGVTLMIITALTPAMAIIRERETGTIESLIVSPVRPAELILGKVVPYALIGCVNVLIVIAAALLIFHVPLRGNFLLLIFLSFMYILTPLSMGMFISTIAESQQTAASMAFLSTNLPAFLLSGFAFPIESMPAALQVITYLVPARFFLVIVRSIFLKGTGFELLIQPTLYLAVFASAFLFLSVMRFRKGL
ncbi:MAG: ABC transporter permease [Firmicutes bacterium]|nr:ABC transporter permease [Bacillota bacterium]